MNTELLPVGTPRGANAGRGGGWLADGFGYFKRSALNWILVTILFFVISVIISLIPFLGTLIIYLLMPVFMGGFMLGCHAQEQGGEFSVNHLFAGFSHNTGQLMLLGVIYLIANVVILLLVILFLIIAPGGGMAALATFQSGDPEAIRSVFSLVMMIFLVGLALYVPLLMAYWFAPALVVLGNLTAIQAIKQSFNGCMVNIVPFLVYGIIALILTFIASIPFMLGWLIFLPVIIASIYVALRDIYAAG